MTTNPKGLGLHSIIPTELVSFRRGCKYIQESMRMILEITRDDANGFLT
jgi:hypothetical protein